MDSFNIGLTGLDAARRALDTVGNNIANAATEGYHRQRVELVPATPVFDGKFSWGTGVDILAITRAVNIFVERQLLDQQGISGHTEQEVTILKSVESALGEFSGSGGISEAIDQFFNALKDLVSHPTELIWQRQFVTAAESLANYFQTLGKTLSDMKSQVATFVNDTVETINTLTSSIAELNQRIQATEITGATAHNIRDQRDRLISDLSKLVGVETYSREFGVVDVSISGTPVVIGADVIEIESGYSSQQKLGVAAEGMSVYRQVEGGKLGGLLSAHNDLIASIAQQLDDLAFAIISNVNKYHVEGVGASGSFSELTGWTLDQTLTLDKLGLQVTDGTIYIRLIDTSTGQIERLQVEVDAETDTLETIAAKIASQDGLDASVLSGRLHIEAEAGYKFDFLPAPLPQPDQTSFAAPSSAPDISLSGIYEGTSNDLLTFAVQGGGEVGNGDWSIIVTDQDGQTVSILDLGSGYVAGERIDLGNGLEVGLGVGFLSDGDTFTVRVLAKSDTSGLLAASGINAFFSGTDASSMDVCSRFEESPSLLATCLGGEYSDNMNAIRMSNLRDEPLDELDGQTIGDYYSSIVTAVGQDIKIRQMRQQNVESMLQNLMSVWNETSGVDINEEAAQMLVFQQMYNALARFMSLVQKTNDTLLALL